MDNDNSKGKTTVPMPQRLRDQRVEYGKAIVSTLSALLMELYGKDFNSRNHHRMMQFAREFSDFQIVSTLST